MRRVWRVCVMGCLFLGTPLLAQEKSDDSTKKLEEVEGQLTASRDQIVALRKEIADLNGQLERVLQQVAALEKLVQSAMTDEAKAKAEAEIKGKALALLETLDKKTIQGQDLWGLYWRYPMTAWSDDLLWGLALAEKNEGKDLRGALYALEELETSHQGASFEAESLKLASLKDVSENRAACTQKAMTPGASDHLYLLLQKAQVQIKAAMIKEAKGTLEKALAEVPQGTDVPIGGEIKGLLQQVDRMKL